MLEIDGLDARYGDSQVLYGVSLHVAKGQGVALLGRNGAGKTTLLKSIAGGGPKANGTARLRSADLLPLPTHRRARLGLALVPEERGIFAHMTVEENLLLARHACAPPRESLRLGQLYDLFPELFKLRARMGNQLSGGQQQILAVARGLMSSPDCLLLDEPTEGVAPLLVQEMATQINKAINARGTALLLTEQCIWFSRACTEYVYVVDSGRIVFSGSWGEFDRQPEIVTRYLAI
ncbi:ABC transporter ATP-binding protein [Cupriavidus numazuensis]|uniref:High-affinity branched-chain amino acid transport ATP-binding protein LivF n=1 Tax=Cupriavidus numazuensis TaxID=221992 RepID=A0ABN7QDL3_9BURK|nr:ABC transporter ATP-binding protein [Cupriavidus numazuensis]CAG2160367.1 High-affinity branched-chain amino acid transport ATP-binding protein LivF [Cupriavidus numazuensis]